MPKSLVKFPVMAEFCRNFTSSFSNLLISHIKQVNSFLSQWFPWTSWDNIASEIKIELVLHTLTYSLYRIKSNNPTNQMILNLNQPTPFTQHSEKYVHDFFIIFQDNEFTQMVQSFQNFWENLSRSADLGNFILESPYSAIPYANFLQEYNSSLVKKRGVVHTPAVVIRAIWNGLHALLQTELNYSQGMLSDDLHFYDPAVGSLDFEIEFLESAFQTHQENSDLIVNAWLEKFFKNFRGNEISPTAAAIGWLLWQDCFTLLFPKRSSPTVLQVSFLNTLSTANYNPFDFQIATSSIMDISQIPLVIFGNPPYAVSSANKKTWILPLMKRYAVNEPNLTRLYDDYVKFFRYAHWLLESRSSGIIAFISNRKFLDGKIFYGMRKALLEDFSAIYIIDLFGDTRNSKHTSASAPEKIFNIQTGVCITFLIKTHRQKSLANLYYFPVLSDPTKELANVWSKDNFQQIVPLSPQYLFIPQEIDPNIAQIWNFNTISLPDCFLKTSRAMISSRDAFMVDPDRKELELNIMQLKVRDYPQLRLRGRIKTTHDDILESEEIVQTFDFARMQQSILPVNYRAWDQRFCIFYTINQRCGKSVFLDYLRTSPTTKIFSLDDPNSTRNIALNFVQSVQKPPFSHILITEGIVDSGFFGYSTSKVAPLWINDQSNISPHLLNIMKSVDQNCSISEIVSYIYGILHCSILNETFLPFLLHEFPRVLIPPTSHFFHAICVIGQELIKLHLYKWNSTTGVEINQNIEKFHVSDRFQCRLYSYDDSKQELHLNFASDDGMNKENDVIFPITLSVWQYRIGSVRVISHWLDARLYPSYRPSWTHLEWNALHSICIIIQQTLSFILQLNTIIQENILF